MPQGINLSAWYAKSVHNRDSFLTHCNWPRHGRDSSWLCRWIVICANYWRWTWQADLHHIWAMVSSGIVSAWWWYRWGIDMSSHENHLVTIWQTAKKIHILFFSHSRHIGKILKFKIQYPELKFEFKSEKICCCMGPNRNHMSNVTWKCLWTKLVYMTGRSR